MAKIIDMLLGLRQRGPSAGPPNRRPERRRHPLLHLPPEPDPDMQSFVAFIEPQDEPEVLHQRIGRDLEGSIECTFRNGSCLVGVVLFGNGGEGLTIVCPDEEGYAPEIARILKTHL